MISVLLPPHYGIVVARSLKKEDMKALVVGGLVTLQPI